MLQIDKANFVKHGLLNDLLDAIDGWIERKEISVDDEGRLKTRATLRSIAGKTFDSKMGEVSIAGIIARKNGYDGTTLCLRGSDFVDAGADFLHDILSDHAKYLLPTSKAQPKVSNNLGTSSASVLAACGL